MKKLIMLAFGTAVVCALNIGCTASAGIHPTSTAKPSSTVQVAYVTDARAK
jgi:hypothetical protein